MGKYTFKNESAGNKECDLWNFEFMASDVIISSAAVLEIILWDFIPIGSN